ncbi:hypothetical protein ALC57_15452, partial [Trachymyrmex cornetzi]
EQLSNNFVNIIKIPKEINSNNREIELEIVDGSMNPLIVSKPVASIRDPTKLNVGFQAKVESKNLPLSPIRGDVSTNVQLANQAKWLQDTLSSESKASKEFSSEEEWVKIPTRSPRDREEEREYFYLYIPDIKDTLKDKFTKASMQLGLDVGVTSKKDTDKIDTLIINNRSRGKKHYIWLCKRLIDGSIMSLIQKLHGKDCVKLPRSEFYLESNTKNVNWKKDSTVRLIGLKIGTKPGDGKVILQHFGSGNNENKQRSGVMDMVEASILDTLANYDESSMKATDKHGTGLNINMPLIDGKIANLLHDGKLSLSASTALKV